MFHAIPAPIQECMRDLEARDAVERLGSLPKHQRLAQVPPEVGRFLALMCANAPKGMVFDIGTSGGYSGLWLALACMVRGDKLTTFEIQEEKVQMAQKTFNVAGLASMVKVIHGDVRQHISRFPPTAFIFMDAEKDVYLDCYEHIIPNLVSGGLLIANSALSQTQQLSLYLHRAYQDTRVDVMIVPLGKGLLICRKC
ncbi:MAG: methyltransferase [Anaerolineae bacterium]|nr:MAG: methyltransferase [Anaerolineae bacterium]